MRALGALGLSVAATFTPAWSYVPAPLRATLAAQSGGSLDLPARTPSFYRYRSGAAVRSGILSVRFTNRVRVRTGVWRWTNQSFVWQVRRIAAAADCRGFGSAQKTLQVDGNKVFWSPNQAWRCVTGRRGRRYALVAWDGSGKLPDVALAIVAASGADVSAR